MVARINTSKSIVKALNYNEEKVLQEKAECLIAVGFLKDVEHLTFHNKLKHFERLINLNERVSTNTLHISLNFDPSEQLSREKLKEIAAAYMEKIGFGQQPYLVYQHYDAGHPHIHIVSTNIKPSGERISMHNLGKNQSQKARIEIERQFKLVPAGGKKMRQEPELQAINAQKVTYGKSSTKSALSNVLQVVINQYKFTSIAELNAVLGLYNVKAERGEEASRLYQKEGLLYRVLDGKGMAVGTPIKASAFHFKPTLQNLERKFKENGVARMGVQKQVATKVNWALLGKKSGLDAFKRDLLKQGVQAIFRQNGAGIIYGVTYVDLNLKAVFNGSDLGKNLSAKAVLEQLNIPVQQSTILKSEIKQEKSGQKVNKNMREQSLNFKLNTKMLDELVKPEQSLNYVPVQLKKSNKRKKRQSPNL